MTKIQLNWWQNNHRHIVLDTPQDGEATKYIPYKYEDTLKAYDDPKNADTDGNGVIDNYGGH